MSTFFPIDALILAAIGGLAISMTVLLVIQMRNAARYRDLTYPVYEYAIKKAEHEADAIIKKAQEKARGITAQAEEAGQRIISEYTHTAEKVRDAHTASIAQLAEDLSGHLNDAAKTGETQMQEQTASVLRLVETKFDHTVTSFGDAAKLSENAAAQFQARAAEAVEAMEQKLSNVGDALAAKMAQEDERVQEHITLRLEKALSAAEKNISVYERSRMSLLDSHIERLVEDVTVEVLHKQLTLDEHAALAREALQEAKAQHVL